MSWFQEGTPVPPLWPPHSTVFNQLTLYPLANLVPSLRQYQSHRYCGEPPRTHSLCSSPQLDTHKDTKAYNTRAQAPLSSVHNNYQRTPEQLYSSSLCVGGAACSPSSSTNQLQAQHFTLTFWDFSLSHSSPS